eukprot:TRINITY_DN2347_c0_g2_i1.p1 TRINITY_DN2347_c0_g2~~TRINITY_DN2347_c0_g2_i1.p1  ORF type:complete len:355 (+),score=45.14 TRINITY_DN2347_c0_g2_i1:140-1204(+)
MTSQWSSLESWRNEIKDEDKRLLGAAIGSLKTPPQSFVELKKSASNSRGASIGNYQITFEDRSFLLIFFPIETRTPPCYMYFNKNMIVGVLLDRLCQMVELKMDSGTALDSPTRPHLVRVSTHEVLAPNSTLGSNELVSHEDVALCVGSVLPEFYPKPKKKAMKPASDPPQQEPTTNPPEVHEDPPEEQPPCSDDIFPDSADTPPGGVYLSDYKFKNKRLQPLGDKTVSGTKRVQLAVFFNIEGVPPTGVYTFFSQDWVAGRCCDTSMTLAEIPNPNLKITDPSKKLVIYNLRTRKLMPSSTRLTDCCESGDPVLVSVAGGIPKWMAIESLKYTSPTKDFEKIAKRKVRECCLM